MFCYNITTSFFSIDIFFSYNEGLFDLLLKIDKTQVISIFLSHNSLSTIAIKFI